MPVDELKPGMIKRANQLVDAQNVASHIGSGSLQVYATPAMAALIERTCRSMLEPFLMPGETSVGVELSIEHKAPSPIGVTVEVEVEVIEVDGQLVKFRAEVRDSIELIGQAHHTRAVIDVDRFQKRLAKKLVASGEPPPGS